MFSSFPSLDCGRRNSQELSFFVTVTQSISLRTGTAVVKAEDLRWQENSPWRVCPSTKDCGEVLPHAGEDRLGPECQIETAPGSLNLRSVV